jgi:hypothetical protein
MNNEPVAWIGKPELQFGFTDTRVTNEKESWDDIPLYTHPVKEQELLGEIAHLKAELDTANKAYMWMDETYKGNLAEIEALKARPAKELTDEEILEAWQEAKHTALNTKGNFVEVLFARAILRKAQEK